MRLVGKSLSKNHTYQMAIVSRIVYDIIDPQHDKTKKKKITCASSKDSDQPGYLPRGIQVFTGRTGHFVGFVMLWLISI